MRYLPHTTDDIRQMLETIGVDSIDDLFSGVPDVRSGTHIYLWN